MATSEQNHKTQTKKELRDIAVQIVRARKSGTFIRRPSLIRPTLTLEEAYKIYLIAHSILEEESYTKRGRKLGFTNRQTWDEFELSAPIWAYVYEQTIEFKNETVVEIDGFASPRIEPEIVLGLNQKILEYGHPGIPITDVVDWIAIGFEIVDCHYKQWNFNAPDIVIDFGAHARLIVGDLINIDKERTTLEKLTESLSVRLFKGGDLVDTGQGENVLGGPLRALNFLTNELGKMPEKFALQPGEIVTTGTLTKIPYIHKGERWKVEVEGLKLGQLSITIK